MNLHNIPRELTLTEEQKNAMIGLYYGLANRHNTYRIDSHNILWLWEPYSPESIHWTNILPNMPEYARTGAGIVGGVHRIHVDHIDMGVFYISYSDDGGRPPIEGPRD